MPVAVMKEVHTCDAIDTSKGRGWVEEDLTEEASRVCRALDVGFWIAELAGLYEEIRDGWNAVCLQRLSVDLVGSQFAWFWTVY